jgi:hypothetical protein
MWKEIVTHNQTSPQTVPLGIEHDKLLRKIKGNKEKINKI